MMDHKFQWCEPALGIAANDNHWCVEHLGARRILFSFTKKGYALSCHFASDKAGLRHIKSAINDFCEWAFWAFEWCQMILANVKKPSVERIVKKCGFTHVIDHDGHKIYMRRKP